MQAESEEAEMASNEDPGMSENPCDDLVFCYNCNRRCRVDDLYGSILEEEKTFCSQICAEDYEDEWEPEASDTHNESKEVQP